VQKLAYDDSLAQPGVKGQWRLHMGMDEYPFFPADTEPGFLARYLDGLNQDVNLVIFKNAIFGGPPAPEGVRRISGYTLSDMEGGGTLYKYVFKTAHVASVGVHDASVSTGTSINLDPKIGFMVHLQGPRLQKYFEPGCCIGEPACNGTSASHGLMFCRW
jgi:hypothetical protein